MAADALLDRFDEIVAMLAEHPEAGRARHELGAAIRVFPVDSYLIFYRAAADRLDMVRILHAARDVRPDLLPPWR